MSYRVDPIEGTNQRFGCLLFETREEAEEFAKETYQSLTFNTYKIEQETNPANAMFSKERGLKLYSWVRTLYAKLND